ncbi:hypothetical protein PIROE2DRAFT_2767, partial [Piromyces sp. E2]
MEITNKCGTLKTPIAKTLVVKSVEPNLDNDSSSNKETVVNKRINKKKVIFEEQPTVRNFDYLDDNYFDEYERCLRGNSYNSNRYKRLSSIEVSKFDLSRTKKKPFKKQKKQKSKNYFDCQLSSQSLCSSRKLFSSIKNVSNGIQSKVDCDFDKIMSSRYNSNNNINNSSKSLPTISKDGNFQPNEENKLLQSKLDTSEKENKQPTKISISKNNKVISVTKENNKKSHTLKDDLKKYKEEFFSTELLLQDSDDIFHINEDLFMHERNSDKDEHLLENNYNVANTKFLYHYKNKQLNEINPPNPVNEPSIDTEDNNKIYIYNSCNRKNLKKISNIMAAAKHITRNKSIYINFDYSDKEYGDSSSSYSSDSSYTKYQTSKESVSIETNKKSYSEETNKESVSIETNKEPYSKETNMEPCDDPMDQDNE